jgi:hypothetical protein
MTRLRLALVALALLAGAACAGGVPPGQAPPTANLNAITPEDWGERPFYSAYDVIASLRPIWLSLRGSNGMVQVYVDDNHVGGVEILRTLRLSSVVLIRHMDGIQATARYGAGHELGAVLVTTRGSR